MSGGRPSRPQPPVGDHPSCTNEERKDGETAGCARTPDLIGGKGLVLTEDGAAGPQAKESFSPSGLAEDYAQGMEAEWPRPPWRARFTTARSEGCATENIVRGKKLRRRERL